MRKLMLCTDLPPLGFVGDIVEVKDGYARNYLIPQNLAVEPTPANIKRVEEQKKIIEAKRAEELKAKKALAQKIDGTEITIVVKANEQGHLFGSVGPKEIADAMKEEGYNIDPDMIKLDEHIKQVDKYEVTIELAPEASSKIVLWVSPAKQEDQEEQTDSDGKEQEE